jgi:peptidoglycan/xylan/chitin deacetylase (PgdA/CDA1 family)
VCSVTLTFDDGIKEQATMVLPQLTKRGLKATFAIIGGRVGSEFKHTQLVSWNDVRTISHAGNEIASHGWLHRKMPLLSPSDLRQEIDSNDSIIVANIGVRPQTFVFPYNSRSTEIYEQACKGRIGARMFQVALGYKKSHVTEDTTRQWIERTKKKGSWLITMTHGITVGYDALEDSTQVLWNFMDMLKSQEDSVWTGTLAEVTAYTLERDSIKLDTDVKDKTIFVVPSLHLDKNIYHEMLTMVLEKTDLHNIEIKQDGRYLKPYRQGENTLFDFNPYGGKINIQTNLK